MSDQDTDSQNGSETTSKTVKHKTVDENGNVHIHKQVQTTEGVNSSTTEKTTDVNKSAE